MGLWYGASSDATLVALVAPGPGRTFTVEIVPDIASAPGEAIQATVRELRYYLVELGEPNPWAYAAYHCGTAANLYSSVQWGHFPFGAAADGAALSDPAVDARVSET
jgi:hypothetical protein